MSADLRTILKSLKSTLEADSPAVSQYLPYVEAALTADAARAQGAIQVLDWANFNEIKLNREWLPDDQELIYTAIDAYNGEGDMDDDCLEQIIERLLLAWRRAEAARAQRAEVEPVAWQWRWKNNSCPWDQGRVPNWVKEAGDVVEERALYTAPPAPQPTEREKVLEERLQAIIDWADLAMKNADEFDSHGVRNLDGPVFDAAREALAGGEA